MPRPNPARNLQDEHKPEPPHAAGHSPSVKRALPPVGVHRTVEQLPQSTTVCECENTVVLRVAVVGRRRWWVRVGVCWCDAGVKARRPGAGVVCGGRVHASACVRVSGHAWQQLVCALMCVHHRRAPLLHACARAGDAEGVQIHACARVLACGRALTC